MQFNISKKLQNVFLQKQSNRGSSYQYEAPEKIMNQEYSLKIDVYSFGILLYEAITRNEPYPDQFIDEVYDLVKSGKRPKIPDNVSKSFRDLIESCWSMEIDKRPTFKSIYQKLAFNKKESLNDNNNYYLENVDVGKVFEYILSID